MLGRNQIITERMLNFIKSPLVFSIVVGIIFSTAIDLAAQDTSNTKNQPTEINNQSPQAKPSNATSVTKSNNSKKKPSRKRRANLSPKQQKQRQARLESIIKKGLEDGTISLDRLGEIESKYFKKDFRYEPYVNQHPYMPHKWDYGIELGSTKFDESLYWVGGNLGYNIGTCVFSDHPGCQQYFDILIGSSGKEGLTNNYALLSMRWQFINFPATNSALFRIFAGTMNQLTDDVSQRKPVYGIGLGLTTYLHPRADFRFEGRLGHTQGIGNFSQLFISVELKVSRWIDFFAGKLEGVGVGTGKIIKKGVGVTGDVIHGTGKVIKKGVSETGDFINKASDEIEN